MTMKPVSPVLPGENWREVNVAEHQDEFITLPAIPLNGGGTLLSRWELSDEDIARLLETRSIYVYVYTGGRPLQPLSLTVERPELRPQTEADHRIR